MSASPWLDEEGDELVPLGLVLREFECEMREQALARLPMTFVEQLTVEVETRGVATLRSILGDAYVERDGFVTVTSPSFVTYENARACDVKTSTWDP